MKRFTRSLRLLLLRRRARKLPPRVAKLILLDFARASDFVLESKHFVIAGNKKRVFLRQPYGNIFKPGEIVLDVHLDIKGESEGTPLEAFRLLTKFVDKFDELKRQGIAGMVGDTPTESLIRFFGRRGAQTIELSQRKKAQVKKKYVVNVLTKGYPAKYAENTPRRIVCRF